VSTAPRTRCRQLLVQVLDSVLTGSETLLRVSLDTRHPSVGTQARRGGVKRVSGLIYEETRGALKVFLENTTRDSVTYTKHARRKTVTALSAVYTLKRQGRTMYGVGVKSNQAVGKSELPTLLSSLSTSPCVAGRGNGVRGPLRFN